jgi:Na+-transporting methylmalonyl-CoA/oxaloacetate decarboxylase gamma subunit
MFMPMLAQATGLQGIAEGNGVAVSITGMLIVFAALVGISVFIGFLPRLLGWLDPWLPAAGRHHAPAPTAKAPQQAEESLVAAIGFVLHARSRSDVKVSDGKRGGE